MDDRRKTAGRHREAVCEALFRNARAEMDDRKKKNSEGQGSQSMKHYSETTEPKWKTQEQQEGVGRWKRGGEVWGVCGLAQIAWGDESRKVNKTIRGRRECGHGQNRRGRTEPV